MSRNSAARPQLLGVKVSLHRNLFGEAFLSRLLQNA